MTRLCTAALLTLVLGLTGCQSTGSLGGTSWTAVEVLAAGETQLVDLDVTFGTDGYVSSRTTHADGRIESSRRKFEVHDNRLLVIMRDEKEDLDVLFRIDGDDLIVTAESFQARMLRMN